MQELASALRSDPEKPTYHVMPRHGWINDPNGPVFFQGKYHVFYQHIINGCEWDFGIVWGHAVSTDLVHWEHLPPALLPSPGGADADGCFSGCCVVDHNDKPTILYTGVRLRSNPECGPLPPPECDLNLPFIESQLVAVPDDGDHTLASWHKQDEPFLPTPPADMPLVGWRDPYIFEFKARDGNGFREWGMLMGSGLKGQGGAVMIYRSEHLTRGWRYEGMLCEADNVDTGAMWECPLLVELNTTGAGRKRGSSGNLEGINTIRDSHTQLSNGTGAAATKAGMRQQRTLGGQTDKAVESEPGNLRTNSGRLGLLSRQLSSQLSISSSSDSLNNMTQAQPRLSPPLKPQQTQYTHLLCISPDAPTNPVLYWLGNFDAENTRFLLKGAKGPLRLDLGDVLYAPNLLEDAQGRHLLWGWLQERRKVGSYDYAGCLSVPRIMHIRNNRLIQEPAPEVNELRRGTPWYQHNLMIHPEESMPLEGVFGASLDIEFTIERGQASAAGLLLRSWNAGGEGSAAIVFDWERGVLEAIFENPAPQDAAAPSAETENVRRVGGPVETDANEPVTMRVLVDHSCLEVYLSTGEVLSTRVYREYPPPGADAGIDFVAFGGSATVHRWQAWEMRTIWKRELKAHDMTSFETIYEPITAVMPIGSPVPA